MKKTKILTVVLWQKKKDFKNYAINPRDTMSKQEKQWPINSKSRKKELKRREKERVLKNYRKFSPN